MKGFCLASSRAPRAKMSTASSLWQCTLKAVTLTTLVLMGIGRQVREAYCQGGGTNLGPRRHHWPPHTRCVWLDRKEARQEDAGAGHTCKLGSWQVWLRPLGLTHDPDATDW